MTVHPFPPMGEPRNHAEEIANARAAMRQGDAMTAILNLDSDPPHETGLGSNAENFARMNGPGPTPLTVILATAALWSLVLIGGCLAVTAWMTAHNAERIEIERIIP